MTIQAKNGVLYDVRFNDNEHFEIERDDVVTGLRKVFVFQDLAIGTFSSKRKETIFYSYDISPTGERTFSKRHSFKDSDLEFLTFLQSEVWEVLKTSVLDGFLHKIEYTERTNNY